MVMRALGFSVTALGMAPVTSPTSQMQQTKSPSGWHLLQMQYGPAANSDISLIPWWNVLHFCLPNTDIEHFCNYGWMMWVTPGQTTSRHLVLEKETKYQVLRNFPRFWWQPLEAQSCVLRVLLILVVFLLSWWKAIFLLCLAPQRDCFLQIWHIFMFLQQHLLPASLCQTVKSK